MRRARAPFPSCTGCAVLRPRLAFGCGWFLWRKWGSREMLRFYTCHSSVPQVHVCSSPIWLPPHSACFLSPMPPPGRWLSGPGVERSQENSRRDPGEGQHRGECAGIAPPPSQQWARARAPGPVYIYSCPLHVCTGRVSAAPAGRSVPRPVCTCCRTEPWCPCAHIIGVMLSCPTQVSGLHGTWWHGPRHTGSPSAIL